MVLKALRAPSCTTNWTSSHAMSNRLQQKDKNKMVTKMWSLKYSEVTTLTLSGHVTSSFTWPLDLQHMVSHKLSIETTALSHIVAEILHVKHLATPNYHWKCNDDHFGVYGSKLGGKNIFQWTNFLISLTIVRCWNGGKKYMLYAADIGFGHKTRQPLLYNKNVFTHSVNSNSNTDSVYGAIIMALLSQGYTRFIIIYNYSARKLILIWPSHGR